MSNRDQIWTADFTWKILRMNRYYKAGFDRISEEARRKNINLTEYFSNLREGNLEIAGNLLTKRDFDKNITRHIDFKFDGWDIFRQAFSRIINFPLPYQWQTLPQHLVEQVVFVPVRMIQEDETNLPLYSRENSHLKLIKIEINQNFSKQQILSAIEDSLSKTILKQSEMGRLNATKNLEAQFELWQEYQNNSNETKANLGRKYFRKLSKPGTKGNIVAFNKCANNAINHIEKLIRAFNPTPKDFYIWLD